MGAGNLRLDAGRIEPVRRCVIRIIVRLQFLAHCLPLFPLRRCLSPILRPCASAAAHLSLGRQPIEGHVILHHPGILGPHFGHHIGQYEAAGHCHPGHSLAVELDAGVQPAIRAQLADDKQGDVFAGHARPELTGDGNLDALRHAQPQLPRGPNCGHLAAAHTGGKGPQRPGMGRVAVRAKQQDAGIDQPFFT